MSCCCTLSWSTLVSEQLLPLCSIGWALVSNILHPNLTYFNSKSLGIPSVSSTLGARVDLNQHIKTVSKQLRWRGEAKTMCAVILSRCETQCTPYMVLMIIALSIICPSPIPCHCRQRFILHHLRTIVFKQIISAQYILPLNV